MPNSEYRNSESIRIERKRGPRYGTKMIRKPVPRKYQIGDRVQIRVETDDDCAYDELYRNGVYEGWCMKDGVIYCVLKQPNGYEFKYRLIPLTRIRPKSLQELGGVPESILEEKV